MAKENPKEQFSERLKNFEQVTLLSVTKLINSNSSEKALIALFKDILTQNILIERVLFYTFDATWKIKIEHNAIPIKNPEKIDEYFTLQDEFIILNELENNPFPNFDILISTFHKGKPKSFLLLGDVKGECVEISPIAAHLPFIRTLINIFVTALQNRQLYKENLKQVVTQKELAMASEMQNLLIPKDLPHNKEVEMAAFYRPHQFIGGDYYDYIPVNEDEFIICIADVSGKGISAALLMSNLQANLRILLKYTSSLEELVERLNQNLYDNTKGERFITAFLSVYNKKTRLLTYINAGHNSPVLINGKNIKKLEIGCTVLGAFRELPHISKGRFILKKPALLFCYTDGLVELEDEHQKPLGFEKLKEYIFDLKDYHPENIIQKIYEIAEFYKGKSDFKDDLTMICGKYY